MSDFDSRLRDVLHDRAGDVDTPSMPDDVRKSIRRRRAAGGAIAVAVTAAVIAVFVLSLSVLLPLSDGGKEQPAGAGDLSDEPIVAPSKAVTTASLPFVTLWYPKSWFALVSDDNDVSTTSPEMGADHILVTNFDAGMDTGLCLDGGSTIPDDGVVMHIGSRAAPIAIPGDGYVNSIEELRSNGSKLAQTCSAGEVLAGGSPRESENIPAMWIVIIAGPEADPSIVDQMISIMDDGSAPVELQPSAVDASGGPVALIGEGSTPALRWAMTIQPAADFGALPMLNAIEAEKEIFLLGGGSTTEETVTTFPSGPTGLAAQTKDGGWEIAIGGLTVPNVASIEVQSDGASPIGTPTIMRVPESTFGAPVNAFEVSLEVPRGQGELGMFILMAYDSDGVLLSAAALTNRGPAVQGGTMLELGEDQQVLDAARTAADKSAQASLRNALVAAHTAYTDFDTYTDITPKLLHEIEPTIEFDAGTTAEIGTVSIREATETGIMLVTRSATDTSFCISDYNETTFGTQDAQISAECIGVAWPEP